MLARLYISNVALISELDIAFSRGLNVITGETGAGKSIIIDSINLVLGERAERDLIKHGELKARVEAVFDISNNIVVKELLTEQEIDFDDLTITVSRELSISPTNPSTVKSVCRINGVLVNISTLKLITEHIVDVHGQHEHQSLLSPKHHITYLDAYAGKSIESIKERVSTAYYSYKKTQKELLNGFVSEAEKARQIDILTFQINEIESVHLVVGEEDKLESEREVLANSERITHTLNSAGEALLGEDGGSLYALKDACHHMSDIVQLSDEYKQITDTLNELYYALEDASYLVRGCRESFSFDPQRLDEIQSHLNAISLLKRKYGGCEEAVLRYLDNAREELDNLTASDEQRKKLMEDLEGFKSAYVLAAQELSDARILAAEDFTAKVIDELAQLGLGKAKFAVSFSKLADDVPSPNGVDDLEFMLSANPGEPEKSLSKVASGGEMSRIMLSLKTVLSDCGEVGSMIFDEIDTGISGTTASIVGKKMHNLGASRQIIAITHLAQIAAYADAHYLVEKMQTDFATSSALRLLTDEEHCAELARIMGGTDALSVEHARAMINKARGVA